jgi:hypothetical protein
MTEAEFKAKVKEMFGFVVDNEDALIAEPLGEPDEGIMADIILKDDDGMDLGRVEIVALANDGWKVKAQLMIDLKGGGCSIMELQPISADNRKWLR